MKRRDEVLVGLFTVVAVSILVLGALWLARGGLQAGYPLYAKFPWGAGLKTGQPVLLVGVTVGFVEEVKLEQDGTLITSFRIRDEYKVPKGSTATVVANGIFGDMAIALTPKGPNAESIASGDTVPVGPAAPGIANLIARMDTVSRDISGITLSARTILVDSGGIAELRNTMRSTNALVRQLSQIADVQSRELQLTLASVRRTTSAIDSASVDSTVRNIRAATAELRQLATDLRTTSARVDALVAKADSGDGTAGRLLNDPALYEDMRRLLVRVDSTVADFKRNPRRYVKLSIF